MHPTHADRMMAVVRKFGFDSPKLTAELFLKDESIVRMGVPPVQIEIVTTISGVDFSECYDKRNIEKIDYIRTNLISLCHLKMNKKPSGRHKDLDDLDHLG